MLTKIDNKENVPPGQSTSSSEQKDQPMHSMWRWLRQHVPFIQDTIIKFVTNRSLVNSSKFWEIDGDTYVLEHDYINAFIAKCTLHRAIVLTSIQIPVLIIVVALIKDHAKSLLCVAAFVAKFEDLLPCIFQLQIQPGFHQLSPILALPTHRDALDLFLNQAPLLPKDYGSINEAYAWGT